MFQLSKKKVFLIIIVWIILLLITGGVTYYFKVIKVNNTTNNVVIAPEYNERDYYSFYDENDLKTEEMKIDTDKEYSTFSYIKISGLKDKNILNKINNELYDFVKDRKDNKASYVYSNVSLNAFNILSVKVYVNYYEESGLGDNDYTFNYDLNTGKKIEFDDLFTNTANVLGILYTGCYDKLSTDLSFELLHLDREIKATELYGKTGDETQYYSGRNLNDLKKEKEEKQRQLDNVEDLAAIMSKKLFNTKDKKFYLTNSSIIIIYDGEEIVLKSRKNMEYMAYYYRYLNNKKIYDNDNIGKNNLFLSGIDNNSINYVRVEKIDDYGLIDYEKFDLSTSDNEISYMDKKINEYKNSFDKSKFNYLNIDTYSNAYENPDIEYITGTINLCTMSKEYFNNTYLEKLFLEKEVSEAGGFNQYYLDENDDNFKCDSKKINVIAVNDHVYDKVEDIFVSNFDYKNYFLQKYYDNYFSKFNSYDDIIKIKDKMKYAFSAGYIDIYFEDTHLDVWDRVFIEIDKIPKEYLKMNV